MTNGNIILCGKDVKHRISSYETIHKHICVSRACYQTFTNRNAGVLGIICIFAETIAEVSSTKNATKKNRNETLQNYEDDSSDTALSRLLHSLRTAGRMERRPQRDGHEAAAGIQLLD